MCGTCGCGGEGARIDGDPHHHHHEHAHAHDHHDGHDHHHDHDHPHDHDHHHHHEHDDAVGSRLIRLETDLLAKNNALAAANRERFRASNILALNLLSSPGSGKTSLLVRTLEALGGEFAAAVIEGDQQTDLDADRIRKTGVPAVQINTGKGCHLDAHMVGHAVDHLSPADGSVLFIENVGNLVCPAAFDLGEAFRVVILSVTEGDDKPLKYPDMFAAADLALINKIDLLAHVDFDMDKAIAAARRVNPRVRALPVSARTGEGIEGWINWIRGARMMAG